MQRDTIERLAMDMAMGQLDDDVKTLLTDYLDEHPNEKTWAHEMIKDCNIIEDTLKTKTKLPQAQYKKQNFKKTIIFLNANIKSFSKVAAVFIFASMIGIGFSRFPKQLETFTKLPGREQKSEFLIRQITPDTPEQGEGFWQVKAAAFTEPRQHTINRASQNAGNLWANYQNTQEAYYD